MHLLQQAQVLLVSSVFGTKKPLFHFLLYFVIEGGNFEAKPTAETCSLYPKTQVYIFRRKKSI